MRLRLPFRLSESKAVLALLLPLSVASCEWKPDRPPLDLSSAFTPEPPASPTPTPLPEGEWSLSATEAVIGTAGAMTLATNAAPSCATKLPAKVILSGERGWYQLTGGRLTPAHGTWDGAQLSLEATKVRNARPTSDCVSETTERWTLLGDQASLAGALHVASANVAGTECSPACEERLDVTLTFLAAKPEAEPTPTPEPEPSPSPSPTPKKKKPKTR